jgi:FkbM family methyltransferase
MGETGNVARYVPHHSCQIPGLAEIYLRVFGYRTNGTFVEVGAYDGETVSNTSCLADIGWRGVYIEPVPQYAQACRDRHRANGNVSVVQCAVGQSETPVSLHVGGVLSTSDPQMVRVYGQIDWAAGFHRGASLVVPQRRLEAILTAEKISPGFELLVIDVEGGEEGVFAGFDLAAWRPQMLIIELEDYHPSFQKFPSVVERARRIRNMVVANGYTEIYRDTINTVFWNDAVAKENPASHSSEKRQ